jgi:hypothetical protein
VPPAIAPLELNQQELEQILDQALTAPLARDDYDKLRAVLNTLAYMTQLLEKKNTTLERLRQIVFGSSSEKTKRVLPQANSDGGTVPSPHTPQSQEQASEPPLPSSESTDSERPGHGRNGAQAYNGAEKIKIEHATLKPGDRCPKCEKGKVYTTPPGVLVRVVGQAPLLPSMNWRSFAATFAVRCLLQNHQPERDRRSMTPRRPA